jgi:leader peptidase (prepilin peptidase) / N-methyltransferase
MDSSFYNIFNGQNWAPVPFHFWSAVFFALGCIVGSFLNVCIHRLPLGMSVVTPPSHCPHCHYSIPWWLNIPLVTWLALRGRCNNCRAPISPRYFIVELLTGTAFLACWLHFGNRDHPLPSMPVALVYAIFLAGLICATFIDFEHFIIPDEITLGGIVVGVVASLALPSLQGVSTVKWALLRSLFGAAFGASLLYAVLRLGKLLFGRQTIKFPAETRIIFSETSLHLPDREIPYEELFFRKSDVIITAAKQVEMIDRSYFNAVVKLSRESLRIEQDKFEAQEFSPEDVHHLEIVSDEIVLPREAMGLGDVKFMSAIGAFLGWSGVIFSVMISSLVGSVVGVGLILMRRREWSSRIPYGPYIALAAAIWVFVGRKLTAMLFPL